MKNEKKGMAIYLQPTGAIDSDSNTLIDTARRIAGNGTSLKEKAINLFYFVRDEIHYNVYFISTYREDFRASKVLERKKGYCVQKAILLAALARAIQIPSRLVFAKIRNHRAPKELVAQTGQNVFPSHGYTQLYIQERWINLTPAFDSQLCEKTGVPAVDFDGEHDAILPAFDFSGNPYIEYIEKYEPQADFPFQWLRARVLPLWGEKKSWLAMEDAEGHIMPSGYRF